MSSDPRAFDVGDAARRHERELVGFAFRVTGDREAARDAVQDALLRAVRAVGEGSVPENLRAWLYRLVYHAAVDRRRRRSLEEAARQRVSPPAAPGAGTSGDPLERVVSALPSPHREIVVLRYVQDFTYAEMEMVLNRPAATLRVYAARALEMLHAQLGGGRHGV